MNAAISKEITVTAYYGCERRVFSFYGTEREFSKWVDKVTAGCTEWSRNNR